MRFFSYFFYPKSLQLFCMRNKEFHESYSQHFRYEFNIKHNNCECARIEEYSSRYGFRDNENDIVIVLKNKKYNMNNFNLMYYFYKSNDLKKEV